MKKRIVSVFMLLAVVLTMLGSCSMNVFKSDEELIRDRVYSFQKAYNNGDMDGIMESLDSKSRVAMEATLGIAEAFGGALLGIDGISLSDLFGVSMGIMEGEPLQVEIQSVEIDGEEATVTGSMEISLKDSFGLMEENSESLENVTFSLVKEDDDWYISNMMQ